MPRSVLHHRHEAADRGLVLASSRGLASRSRHCAAPASGPRGGSETWQAADAASEADLLAPPPRSFTAGTTAPGVDDVEIPSMPEEER
jgi:hypothetical protein